MRPSPLRRPELCCALLFFALAAGCDDPYGRHYDAGPETPWRDTEEDADAGDDADGGPATDLTGDAPGDGGPDADGTTGRPSFVYVLANPAGPNAVQALARNSATGELTLLGQTLTGGQGDPYVAGFEQHALAVKDDVLYAVNPGDDTLSALRIGKDGSLTPLGTLPSDGRRPTSLAIDGDLLYVGNSGHSPIQKDVAPASYRGFTIGADGTLSPLACPAVPATAGPNGATIADVVILRTGADGAGRVLAAAGLLPDLIESFRIDEAGCLQDGKTVPGRGGPYGLARSPSQSDLLLATLGLPDVFPGLAAPGVASYRAAADGTLDLVGTYTAPDVDDEGLRDPCWLVFATDDSRFWTSSFVSRALTSFSLDAAGIPTQTDLSNPGDTLPNPMDPSAPEVVLGSTDIALSPDGQHLYQLRAFSVPDGTIPLVPRIVMHRVTANWGEGAGLADGQTLLLPEDLAQAGPTGLVVVDP